jgi:hypothetical protein
MRVQSLVKVSGLVLAIAACADPSALLISASPDLSLGPATNAVIGSGHVEQAAGLREFTYHAVARADGSVSGSYKIVLASGLFFEADVTCLSVVGNTGWVGGVIRATNAAAVNIGSASTFFAIDNGEGDGAAADVVSNATFNGGAGADLVFCANRALALPQLTVTDGNVQVR